MSIKITSLQPIIDMMNTKQYRGVTELASHLQKSKVIIHKYIKELANRHIIQSIGKGSHTRYTLTDFDPNASGDTANEYNYDRSYEYIDILQKYFYKLDVDGAVLSGPEGFVSRCISRGLDPDTKIHNFINIAKYIQKAQNECGLIDVSDKIHKIIDHSYIDEMYYADQYKRMEFGRGKLAEITFFAKDNQSVQLTQDCIYMIIDRLRCAIRHSGCDAIAYIPHSKKRQIQLLTEIKKKLNMPHIPQISLVKYAPHGHIIAQKSLKTRAQRIQNAQKTILVESYIDVPQYHKIMLIDDFVGSGATLNQTAKKLKHYGCQTIIGRAIVGNSDLSYEVISEI